MSSAIGSSIGVFILLLAYSPSASAQTFSDPQVHLAACIQTSHVGLCEVTRQEFIKDYSGARKGDYQAQRNVAYCLSEGCDGAVLVDRTEGCAWRMVIQGSSVRKEPTERMSYSGACAAKNGANRREAISRAEVMFMAIYRKELPLDKLLGD